MIFHSVLPRFTTDNDMCCCVKSPVFSISWDGGEPTERGLAMGTTGISMQGVIHGDPALLTLVR